MRSVLFAVVNFRRTMYKKKHRPNTDCKMKWLVENQERIRWLEKRNGYRMLSERRMHNRHTRHVVKNRGVVGLIDNDISNFPPLCGSTIMKHDESNSVYRRYKCAAAGNGDRWTIDGYWYERGLYPPAGLQPPPPITAADAWALDFDFTLSQQNGIQVEHASNREYVVTCLFGGARRMQKVGAYVQSMYDAGRCPHIVTRNPVSADVLINIMRIAVPGIRREYWSEESHAPPYPGKLTDDHCKRRILQTGRKIDAICAVMDDMVKA